MAAQLELVHLAGVGGAGRADMAYFSPGVPEGAIPFFGVSVFERPRRDVTTFLTKMVVEFPVADGRLFPYLAAGGGVGRVTGRSGGGDGLIPWLAVDSVFNDPSSVTVSGSDPGTEHANTAYFFDHMTFLRNPGDLERRIRPKLNTESGMLNTRSGEVERRIRST